MWPDGRVVDTPQGNGHKCAVPTKLKDRVTEVQCSLTLLWIVLQKVYVWKPFNLTYQLVNRELSRKCHSLEQGKLVRGVELCKDGHSLDLIVQDGLQVGRGTQNCTHLLIRILHQLHGRRGLKGGRRDAGPQGATARGDAAIADMIRRADSHACTDLPQD